MIRDFTNNWTSKIYCRECLVEGKVDFAAKTIGEITKSVHGDFHLFPCQNLYMLNSEVQSPEICLVTTL